MSAPISTLTGLRGGFAVILLVLCDFKSRDCIAISNRSHFDFATWASRNLSSEMGHSRRAILREDPR